MIKLSTMCMCLLVLGVGLFFLMGAGVTNVDSECYVLSGLLIFRT